MPLVSLVSPGTHSQTPKSSRFRKILGSSIIRHNISYVTESIRQPDFNYNIDHGNSRIIVLGENAPQRI